MGVDRFLAFKENMQYRGSLFLLDDPTQLLGVYNTSCSRRETSFPVLLLYIEHNEQPVGTENPNVTS